MRPDALDTATAVAPTAYLAPEGLAAAVAAARPIYEWLAWLLEAYPDLPLSRLLTAYARVYFGDFGPACSADESRQYRRKHVVLTAHPLELAAEDG